MSESRNGSQDDSEQSEFDESGSVGLPFSVQEFEQDDPPGPETSSVRTSDSFLSNWAQDDHVRLLVTASIVVVVPLVYLLLLIGVLAGWVTVDEAKDLGAVELFSGLITLAGTVIGYYFGKRE